MSLGLQLLQMLISYVTWLIIIANVPIVMSQGFQLLQRFHYYVTGLVVIPNVPVLCHRACSYSKCSCIMSLLIFLKVLMLCHSAYSHCRCSIIIPRGFRCSCIMPLGLYCNYFGCNVTGLLVTADVPTLYLWLSDALVLCHQTFGCSCIMPLGFWMLLYYATGLLDAPVLCHWAYIVIILDAM